MARFTEQFKTNGKFDYKKLMEHRSAAQLDQLTEEPDSEQFTQEVKAAQEKAEGKGKKAEVAKPAVQAVKNEEIEMFDADAINGVTVETITERAKWRNYPYNYKTKTGVAQKISGAEDEWWHGRPSSGRMRAVSDTPPKYGDLSQRPQGSIGGASFIRGKRYRSDIESGKRKGMVSRANIETLKAKIKARHDAPRPYEQDPESKYERLRDTHANKAYKTRAGAHIREDETEKSQGVWKTIKTLRKEATELMQETEMTPKQKNIAKVAGDPHKIDGADLAALRGKKKMEEGQADYILKKHTGGEKKKSVSAKEMSDFKDSLTSFIQTKKMPVNLDKK